MSQKRSGKLNETKIFQRKKMLIIPGNKGNANQNHSMILPHPW
jgi:hypothetical protein